MVIANVKRWWLQRKLTRAQEVIERCGLSVVKFKDVAGTLYFVKPDGTSLKLAQDKRVKR